MWLLGHCNFRLNLVTDPRDSIMAAAAGLLSPLFKPLGLGDWRIITSLVSGFMAKESVVSSLQTLFPDGITAVLSSLSACSMLVFSLLYTPCVAAVASIRRELGRKWALAVVLGQCILAWVAALLVRLIGMLLGG